MKIAQMPALLQIEVLINLFPQTPEPETCDAGQPWEPDEFMGYEDLSVYGDGRDYDHYCQSCWGL